MGEGQREGDTESETGSSLQTVSTEPDAGLELTDREIVTWAEVSRLTDWATQAPRNEGDFREKTLGAGSTPLWILDPNAVYYLWDFVFYPPIGLDPKFF